VDLALLSVLANLPIVFVVTADVSVLQHKNVPGQEHVLKQHVRMGLSAEIDPYNVFALLVRNMNVFVPMIKCMILVDLHALPRVTPWINLPRPAPYNVVRGVFVHLILYRMVRVVSLQVNVHVHLDPVAHPWEWRIICVLMGL